MKVSSSFYKGIQYVQVSALPAEQRERLLHTIDTELFIKLLVDGKVTGNCLQFKDYETWFENVYGPVSSGDLKAKRVSSDAEFADAVAEASAR